MFTNGARSVPDVVQTGYSVDIGKYLGEGWELFKKNAGGFFGFTLIMLLVSIIPQVLPERIKPLGSIASSVLSGPLGAGFYIVAFKLMKQRATTFSDFFRGFNHFLPLFLASLVTGILTLIGFALFVLPGIYLAVAWMFTTPFIVDRKFDFWDAMESSRKVISRNWFSWFIFLIVLALLNFVGFLLFGVGALVTIPLSACAVAIAYQEVMGLSNSGIADEGAGITDSF
ncbi:MULTISPECIES: DUF2189 domain-containing protein [Thermoleptolyngbya]|uniref:hypothetical protein n=1 Tax=Thermoleptolyngbya TaxID=2303528 RepID=UPI001965B467|nr:MULTISPECIES: hypothetical protein [Thermoleptolyngbya]